LVFLCELSKIIIIAPFFTLFRPGFFLQQTKQTSKLDGSVNINLFNWTRPKTIMYGRQSRVFIISQQEKKVNRKDWVFLTLNFYRKKIKPPEWRLYNSYSPFNGSLEKENNANKRCSCLII